MKEMSASMQRASELLTGYDLSLEQQIVGGGSNLVCKDEELWKKVEGLLKDGDAQETHCLGLDPLKVMEESLKAITTTSSHGQTKARGGLEGLTKAFEVLEQAALNLYLGPWREEYKVVKMYSGMFTHYIKPVLSMQHIARLFGMLGYQPCLARHEQEQLRLQSTSFNSASSADLLRLSCAFFLARCECRLLLSALGKHGGETQWELNLVRERQRGHSLQVALENTKKTLEVNQPLKEDAMELSGIDAGLDLDLYTDEQMNGGQRELTLNDDESPKSFTWVSNNNTSPTAATHNNGETSLSSSSTSLPKESICVSTLNYQLSKTSLPGSNATGSCSVSTKQGRRSREGSKKLAFDKADSELHSMNLQPMGICKSEVLPSPEAKQICSCESDSPYFQQCSECNTLHDVTCAFSQNCLSKGHCVLVFDKITEGMKESRASPQSRSVRVGGVGLSPTHSTTNSRLPLALCDDPDSMSRALLPPITYHDCCDLAHPDPQLLCRDCWVFHTGTCRGLEFCQISHQLKPLQQCSDCRGPCLRNPLVLCRYCGSEYCSECWYRRPVECTCGQTFDQSSSV